MNHIQGFLLTIGQPLAPNTVDAIAHELDVVVLFRFLEVIKEGKAGVKEIHIFIKNLPND